MDYANLYSKKSAIMVTDGVAALVALLEAYDMARSLREVIFH